MTEQEIKQLAEEYAAEYVPMYQKVVKIAFFDGMQKAYEAMRDKLSAL